MFFKLTRQNWAFWIDYSYHTRKNIPDAQKLSGWQCHDATMVFVPLKPTLNCPRLRLVMLEMEENKRLSKVIFVAALGAILVFTAAETRMR